MIMGKLLDAFNTWFETVSEKDFNQIWEDTYEKVATALEEDCTRSISYSSQNKLVIELSFQTEYKGCYDLTPNSLDDAA
jgi:hypothetical protein